GCGALVGQIDLHALLHGRGRANNTGTRPPGGPPSPSRDGELRGIEPLLVCAYRTLVPEANVFHVIHAVNHPCTPRFPAAWRVACTTGAGPGRSVGIRTRGGPRPVHEVILSAGAPLSWLLHRAPEEPHPSTPPATGAHASSGHL